MLKWQLGERNTSYLGKFSIEEIEQIKRSLCDPKINDIFKIKPTYISPLKS